MAGTLPFSLSECCIFQLEEMADVVEECDDDECPVCHEEFTDPKILLCGHLVCRKCILSWLETAGKEGGCPLCRHPLLSHVQRDLDQFVSAVDALPTDCAVNVKIDSKKALSSPDVCGACDSNAAATSFCLQCDMKLCTFCTKVHSNLPALSDHVAKELDLLTSDWLASSRRFPCSNHQEKAADMYCSAHEALVCFECAASTHQKCTGLKDIVESATTKRNIIEDQKKRLKEKEASLTAQIDCIDSQVSDTNKKYGEMQIRIKQTFSDLQRALAIREQDLLEKVRERKESFNREKKTRRAKLEKLRTILAAHTERVEKLIASAPDRALLAMMNNLKSRLNDLESEKPASELDDRVNIGDIHFSECMVNSVKKLIEEMGELTDSPPEQNKDELIQSFACNTVTEATFQFVVKNVHQLSEQKGPPCIVRNIPWHILVTPSADMKHLGFFLECGLPNKKATWSCKVSADLRLLSSSQGGKPLTERIDVKMPTRTCTWGLNEFIQMDELTDPKRGYIKDGSVTLEIHLAADAPEGCW